MLTRRRIEIFKCIVDEFVRTAEPIGSKTLMEKYHLPYSSATIRNEMLALEEMGYLEKTHTSSGRIPSTQGYKFYCEHLLEKRMDENTVVLGRNEDLFHDTLEATDLNWIAFSDVTEPVCCTARLNSV